LCLCRWRGEGDSEEESYDFEKKKILATTRVWWVNLVDSRVFFIFSQLTFFLIKSFNIALIGN
jgi:hypothetical protein